MWSIGLIKLRVDGFTDWCYGEWYLQLHGFLRHALSSLMGVWLMHRLALVGHIHSTFTAAASHGCILRFSC